MRAIQRVPALAGAATAFVGAVNVASALTKELPERMRDLLTLAPAGDVQMAHALALPAGVALLLAAYPLARRRRSALDVALALLVVLGFLNLLKGLDVEEAALSWAMAAVLWQSRAAFWFVTPLRRRRHDGAGGGRHRAAPIVRRHGNDTLSAFKLRGDLGRRFSPDGRAFAAYRVEAGTLLVAGDPVGEASAFPALLEDLVGFAHHHGLTLGALGASEGFAQVARDAGLRSLYLGDEAIVPTGPMDLRGGSMKSLRKACNRIARHGFTAELHLARDLDAATLAEMHDVSAAWRDGAPEHGFSMAHDALVDEHLPEAVAVLARDAGGRVQGFLHFVPVFGRPVMSMAFMRRQRETPNGLSDFLVVEAARLLGEHGIDEFSLNFSTGGRWLREPAHLGERLMARGMHLADRWFQIERLLRFNAKFQPRWLPRHLLFERPSALPRVALAAMLAEGQVSLPATPRLRPASSAPRAARSPR